MRQKYGLRAHDRDEKENVLAIVYMHTIRSNKMMRIFFSCGSRFTRCECLKILVLQKSSVTGVDICIKMSPRYELRSSGKPIQILQSECLCKSMEIKKNAHKNNFRVHTKYYEFYANGLIPKQFISEKFTKYTKFMIYLLFGHIILV